VVVDQRHADLLRRLAINDEDAIDRVLRTSVAADVGLSAATVALVRLAALVALHPTAESLHWSITVALAAGATDDDIVDALVAVAPIVGLARLDWVAPDFVDALEVADAGPVSADGAAGAAPTR
jgi:alkylhydroperoxidase/carboxymuconolactone decarboxylase family protein YurZ